MSAARKLYSVKDRDELLEKFRAQSLAECQQLIDTIDGIQVSRIKLEAGLKRDKFAHLHGKIREGLELGDEIVSDNRQLIGEITMTNMLLYAFQADPKHVKNGGDAIDWLHDNGFVVGGNPSKKWTHA